MRFKRADLPGMVIAALAPVGLMVLMLATFRLWHHEGTPLLGTAAAVFAVAAGLLAAFTRFIKRWNVLLGLTLLLLLDIAAVVAMQRTGHDGTSLATALKALGVVLFLGVNATALLDMWTEGLRPVLARRSERIAAARAAAE